MKTGSFNELLPYLDRYMALGTAMSIMDWDANTAAPEEASEYTAKVLGILSQERFCTLINPSVKEIMGRIDEENLSDKEKAIFKKLKKEYEKSETIPADEMTDMDPAVKDAAVSLLKKVRPAVAGIRDKQDRARVVDALLSAIQGPNVMGQVMETTAAHAKRASDAAQANAFETICRESEAAYAARNPHKKKED